MELGIWKNDEDFSTNTIKDGTYKELAIFYGEVISIYYSKKYNELQIRLPDGTYKYFENFSNYYYTLV